MSSFISRLFKLDERYVKKIAKRAEEVLAYENEMAALNDEELKAKTPYFKEIINNLVKEKNYTWKEALDEILPQAYAVAREAAKRVLNQFPFKVQVMGAIVLNDGDVAEMRTGEGKTLTCTMCVYLNALTGRGIHVVTVNEYLAKRDAEWMGVIYNFLGLTVGCNVRALSPTEKREAFECDITYTTNSEVGFDYLRDNMVIRREDRVLRPLYMAVIDEADSILVDESRTPLIISGGYKQTANLYITADRFAKSLSSKQYEIDLKSKSCHLNEDGNKAAEKMFGIKNIYDLEYADLVHNIHQALKANYIMSRDVDYMVKEGEIVIVDQFTGRMLQGRTYSEGLHQAIEAKEGLKVNPETATMATITYQNYFRLYEKIGGMTGTAKTEEEEFMDTYNMRVIQIPTNKPIVRVDAPDKVYQSKEYKFKALLAEVKERHEAGQPILVGTIAVETSEYISNLFTKAGIPHEVLNAKNHEREAHIIEKAGQKGAVTIATNMAGRGTDIKLGEGVKELGGLAVIGSERHEARRIDGQLRGRSGRQGDPGYSRFFVSLEDDLMLRFGGNTGLMGKMFGSLKEEALESKMITNVITGAQERVEGSNYDSRKNVLEYDDVLRKQRELIYAERDKIIDSEDVHPIVIDFFRKVAKNVVLASTIDIDKEPHVVPDELKKKVIPMYFNENELNFNAYEFMAVDKIYDEIAEKLVKKEEDRADIWGRDIFSSVEKQILLRVVDTNWTNHIDKMDKLRNGIHLRSYAQTNPLQSYIQEGFQMFQNMMNTIAEQTVIYLLKAEVRKNVQSEEPKKDVASEGK